jgi:hypothetical protein
MEGAALVAEVKRQNPDASIEEVLDKVRCVMLERIFNEIKDDPFETVVHIVEELHDHSLTLEDVIMVLELFAYARPEFRNEIRGLIDSQSVAVVYKFCQTEFTKNNSSPTCCCMKLLCTSSTKRKSRPPPSKSP